MDLGSLELRPRAYGSLGLISDVACLGARAPELTEAMIGRKCTLNMLIVANTYKRTYKICVCVYIDMCMYVCMYLCKFVRIYVDMCVYVYIYVVL